MSFHRRHISNEQVIRLFKDGGATRVYDWYTRKVDALVLETGLASEIANVINDQDWNLMGKGYIEDEITRRIHEELGIDEIKK